MNKPKFEIHNVKIELLLKDTRGLLRISKTGTSSFVWHVFDKKTRKEEF